MGSKEARVSPGNIVGNFVQRISHGQLGGDLGDGKPGGLGGQGAAARYPRIHLHHDHVAVHGVDGELYVGAPRIHADLAHDGQGGIAHRLVFPIGEGLSRGHGDGVAGMYPHGIHVFDGADDHHVVGVVAHHFQLVLFPAQHRLLQHHLAGQTGVQPSLGDVFQVFGVVCHPPAGTAQGKTGPDDQRKTDRFGNGARLFHGGGDAAFRNFQADAVHGHAEAIAGLGLFDGIQGGADQFHAEFFEHPLTGHFHGGIQAGSDRPRWAAGHRGVPFR